MLIFLSKRFICLNSCYSSLSPYQRFVAKIVMPFLFVTPFSMDKFQNESSFFTKIAHTVMAENMHPRSMNASIVVVWARDNSPGGNKSGRVDDRRREERRRQRHQKFTSMIFFCSTWLGSDSQPGCRGTLGVNFINVLRTRFLYVRLFGSYM